MTPASRPVVPAEKDEAKDAALKALSDYTGIPEPLPPFWNFNVQKALDIMLPAIRESIARDIERQKITVPFGPSTLGWNDATVAAASVARNGAST